MKKEFKQLLFLMLFLFVICHLPAQVGVNILTPHPTAAMQVQSPAGVNRGLLTPSMTSVDRTNISSGTLTAADGLIVYDVNHKMHYYFNAGTSRWISMSPLTLSTPQNSSTTFPSGVITTPTSSVSTTYSLGINKQNPTQALDVVGNATVSGNINAGGNLNISGNNTVSGSSSVNGTLSVNGFPINALVPAGAIMMWSGTLCPQGWAICDGGTYLGLQTPDLRGRFVVGMQSSAGAMWIPTAQYAAVGLTGLTPSNAPADGVTINYGTLGNTGGETGHALSLAEMPNHKHDVSATVNNSNNFGFNSGHYYWLGDGSSQQGNTQIISVTISETPKGSNQIHENRPPYYVLTYIIKLP